MQRHTLARKQSGCYYTPKQLTNYTLRVAGLLDDPHLIGKRFLDPACGRANFLLSVADILITSLQLKGTSPGEIVKIVCQSLYGFDINPEDIEIAKKKLYIRLADLISEAQLSEKGFEMPRFHVYTTDSLDLLEFDTDGASSEIIHSIKRRTGNFSDGFNYIIGNPPYIRIRYLPRDKVTKYRKAFNLAYGNFNTYVLFFELALKLLSNQGVLAFISPDRFLCSVYGEKLHELMGSQFVLSHLSLVDKTSFPYDISVNLAVSVIRHSVDGQTPKLQLKRLAFGEPTVNNEAGSKSRAEALSTCFWTPKLQIDAILVNKLLNTGKKLGNLCKISSCIPTGSDKVFVLTNEQLVTTNIEKNLTHPLLRGRDIQRWRIFDNGLSLVYPYETIRGQLRLVDLEDYPGLLAYLKKHKSKLAKRKRLLNYIEKSPNSWYRYIDPRRPELFEGCKIVTPKISCVNRFALDTTGFYCLNSVFLLASIPSGYENFLLGLLNSSITDFLLAMRCTKIDDSYYRNSFKNLFELPIPLENQTLIKSISEIVEEILRRGVKDKEISDLERKCDLLIYRLFNLSSEEAKIIKDFKNWRHKLLDKAPK